MDADYHLIAESAEDSIFVLDRDFNISYVNTFGAGMLGGSPEMIVGQNIEDLFPPESAKHQKAAIKKIFETGKPVQTEDHYSFESRGIWLSTRLIPIKDKGGNVETVLGISRDITELKNKEIKLEQNESILKERLHHSAVLRELGEALVEDLDETDILERITSGIGRGLDMDKVLIYRIDFEEHVVDGMIEWTNPARPGITPTIDRYSLDLFLNGAIDGWKNKKPLISHYNKVNPILVGDGSSELLHGRMGIKSLLWYPFGYKEHGFFTLVLNQTVKRREFSDEDISLVTRMVTPVEIALQKIDFIKEKERADAEVKDNLVRLKKTLEETVNALAVTAEKKDPYTAGHQRRVVTLSAAIAREMDLNDEMKEGIRIAATVHDIGKIYIPVEILSKPGKLTDLEFGMVQAHSQFGFDILKTVDFPWPIAKIVLQHHERLDGSGYPLGLKGDEICQEARILAVADVVEAMVSDRPYRDSHDRKKTLAELKEGAGVLYDKGVVDACAKLLQSKEFSLD